MKVIRAFALEICSNDINNKIEQLTKIKHFSLFCLNPIARTLSLYYHQFGRLFTNVDGVSNG